jgi:hypothetical protein
VSDTVPLAGVEQIVPARDGAIYLIDSGSPEILVFDREGHYSRSVGRRGPGPGEFLRPWRVGLVGDTLWVIDSEGWRISLFGPDGALAAVYQPLLRASIPGDAIERAPYAVLADRTVLVLTRSAASPDGYGLISMSLEGEVLATLAYLSIAGRMLEVPLPGEGGLQLRNPYSHADMLAVPPSGERVVTLERQEPVADSAANYHVRFMTPSGQVESLEEVGYQPRRLKGADVDRWVEGLEPVRELVEFGLFPSLAAAQQTVRAELDAPVYYPPVANRGPGVLEQAVLVSRDGSVWVERWERDREGTRWDVVVVGRGRVAVATVPPGVRLLAVAGDRAWGVELDEFDVPTIVRYRIDR